MTLFITNCGNGIFLLPKNFSWFVSIIPVNLDHLDSSASSKYDSIMALNVAAVPICVAMYPGERTMTGHP